MDQMRIFTGNSNPPLAQEICQYLETSLGRANVQNFSDGEILVDIDESVRGMDVFVIQSTCTPGNTNLMELLIMIDALKRASANRITAVIPYYGYARQDRKVSPRAPITAKLVADLITATGAHRVLTMDLHAGQIQGFFNIPVDHLFAAPVLLEYIRSRFHDHLVIVSPDSGGVERARAFGKRLKASLAIIDKRRDSPNVAKFMNIIGEVEGLQAVILDDIVDTAGTLVEAASALASNGAARVVACCTHPVLSGQAVKRLSESVIEEIAITNTIPLKREAISNPKFKVLSVGKLLAEAIRRIHCNDSVSSLFV
ncbi:MAG: ribose-phosphate pyrophosphokinase [Deltaproteobacteria bacterium]|nr:ribose-phosphate pyrophosphokinase [Deltaproteobacteria bacterium]